ncbi:MAG: MoaD/ThiS family protein [Rhodocyclaceae bacterium]|nr:MoaD/ThiS family protein [Rhodocyclaceae bacterium]
MRVVLKLFASLSDLLPPQARASNALELDVDPATTIAELIAQQRVPEKSAHLVLVNGQFVPPETRATRTLCANDELAIWPPVAGG